MMVAVCTGSSRCDRRSRRGGKKVSWWDGRRPQLPCTSTQTPGPGPAQCHTQPDCVNMVRCVAKSLHSLRVVTSEEEYFVTGTAPSYN